MTWDANVSPVADVDRAAEYTVFNYDVLTPETFRKITKNMSVCFISYSIWSDITGSQDLVELLLPERDEKKILSGYLGNVDGVDVYTDAFFESDQHILEADEFYAFDDNWDISVAEVKNRQEFLEFLKKTPHHFGRKIETAKLIKLRELVSATQENKSIKELMQ